jgi:hypothetical protein
MSFFVPSVFGENIPTAELGLISAEAERKIAKFLFYLDFYIVTQQDEAQLSLDYMKSCYIPRKVLMFKIETEFTNFNVFNK